MSTAREQIQQELDEIREEAVLLEPDALDRAIIGLSLDRSGFAHIIYDTAKLIQQLMQLHDCDRDEAKEWFDYNVEPLGHLAGGPLFVDLVVTHD